MVGSKKKNIAATILGKVAFNSAKAAADSRCMYCLHQPKQPTGIKKMIIYKAQPEPLSTLSAC